MVLRGLFDVGAVGVVGISVEEWQRAETAASNLLCAPLDSMWEL